MRLSRSLLLVLFAVAPLAARVEVVNVAAGETLRYPAALLVGHADAGERVVVANADNPRPDGRNTAPVVDQRFKVLVELRPGANHLSLFAGGESRDLELDYRPSTSPFKVTLVYLTGRELATAYPSQIDNDPQDYRAKLRTAARLMQTFTGEVMRDEGHGRQTFALECDAEDDPIVHTLAYPDSAAAMRARDPGDQWQRTYQFLSKRLDFTHMKVLCMNAFIAYDPLRHIAVGHTALGGGAQAVFSSNPLCAWPSSLRDVERAFGDPTPVDATRLADDTAYRSTLWALASTGIGAWLHELGHAFGLPHSPDPRCIMSTRRGFDWFARTFVLTEPPHTPGGSPVRFNEQQTAHWDPLFAERLSVSPWFQPDGPTPLVAPAPSLAVDWDTGCFRAGAPAGVAYLQVEGARARGSLPAEQVAGRTEVTLDRAEVDETYGGTEPVVLLLLDRAGRQATLDEKELRDPH
jgi:hypothetical protein